MSHQYVHGYNSRESERLQDQAGTLVNLLHFDTSYPVGSTVPEAGGGSGRRLPQCWKKPKPLSRNEKIHE
jgi:hypothetical protein